MATISEIGIEPIHAALYRLLDTKTGAAASHTEVTYHGAGAAWTPQLATPATLGQGAIPMAFQLAPANPGDITLKVSGRNPAFTANATRASWANKQFRLTGTLPGTSIVLQSAWGVWGPGGNPFDHDDVFHASGFRFVNPPDPAPAVDLSLPFRASGDWTWVISAQNDVGNAL